MMCFQRTLKKTVRVDGIGLHTGAQVSMAVLPAPSGYGIRFKRVDVDKNLEIKTNAQNILSCLHATTIGCKKWQISTIEHLMAAFSGLGIDNALVELDGPEVPALDGSASVYVVLFNEAGIVEQEDPKRYIQVIRKISVCDGDKKVTLLPSDELFIDFKIEFSHPVIRSQRFRSKIDQDIFSRKIAQARTFGFLREVEFLFKNGLARGASLENAIVIGDDSIINEEGLRFSDEFVRHKVLDILGDLYLLGAPLKAKVVAEKSGHELHCRLVKRLLEEEGAWRYVTERPKVTHLRSDAIDIGASSPLSVGFGGV